ncbi:37S ribosomal protein, mitochondrial [Cytospora paraplurivora]|uniref:37S ribosomal protein, mitochondrial n=1 Tax=Cytospora paraplurivora TaxID=2898453 RepID=A0AAN9TY00_9PEZI
MILRNFALRQGRQALSRSCRPAQRAALSTGDKRPPLPTAFADPPSPPPAAEQPSQDVSSAENPLSADDAAADAPREVERALRRAAAKTGGYSPQALWNRQQKVVVDESIADNHRKFTRIQHSVGDLGSVVDTRYDPSSLLRDPPRPEDVTLELLMSAQTHMGHHTSLWNPANQRYIYGVRAGIHIISLEETAAALRRAARVVEEVAYLGGLILFVGNRKGQMEVTARAAELAGSCHLFSKWVPGTITNRDQILGREELRVVDERDRPLAGFEGHLLERRPLLPDLVVVLNPLENYTLLQECAQENIPTIGLVDTDADPTRVTYVIPGNDDSLRSVSVISGVLGRAGERGQERRKRDANSGVCTWRNPADIDKWLQDERARKAKESQAQRENAPSGDRRGGGDRWGGEKRRAQRAEA